MDTPNTHDRVTILACVPYLEVSAHYQRGSPLVWLDIDHGLGFSASRSNLGTVPCAISARLAMRGA
eukprot:COSAG02_NODE_5890_length_3957_cov_6.642043_2_plen_66_part_00